MAVDRPPLRIPTWIEVSTCEVLHLCTVRLLQTAESYFGSVSGTADSARSGRLHSQAACRIAQCTTGCPFGTSTSDRFASQDMIVRFMPSTALFA